jgi:hypothetical protein
MNCLLQSLRSGATLEMEDSAVRDYASALTPGAAPDHKSPSEERRLMAVHKRTRSRKRHSSQLTRFPVRGKIVESVEADSEAITILFQDRTALSFDFEAGLSVFPELSGWETGDWRAIKRWRPIHSKSSMASWT